MSKFKYPPKKRKVYSYFDKKDSISFLELVKNKINKIKTDINNNKKYSLISIIILCFVQNNKCILKRKEIFDFVKNEIVNNPNKIVTTHRFKKSEKDIVTETNYNRKIYFILLNNKIVKKIIPTLNEDKNETQYELNLEFIFRRKNILFQQMFGEHFHEKIVKKRKKIKFDNSLSAIKLNKKKNNNKNEKEKNKEVKDNNLYNENLEVDSSILSIKESEIVNERSKEPSFINSSFTESIKFHPKKADSNEKNNFVNKSELNSNKNGNSNISSNENSLIMPVFNDILFNEKNLKYLDNNERFCSNSLKEINNIINKGEEFLSLLKNPQLLNLLNSNNNYKQLGSSILNSKNINDANNLLKVTSDYYTDLCRYLDFLFYERKNKVESNDENSDTKLIKIKCSLIISGIMSKLYQFLLEYNYFVEIIENIFKYKHNFILKEMLEIINYDKEKISKNKIDSLETLLKLELEKTVLSLD